MVSHPSNSSLTMSGRQNGTTNGGASSSRGELPPAPTIRTRERINIEEEAGQELRLGDFQHVHCLSMSEARLITDAIFDQRKKSGRKVTQTESLTKMQDYMDTYARFKSQPALDEFEALLNQHPDLESFERSQLTTLCPGDADEAKTLIPSLASKIDDGVLNDLLAQINAHRRAVFVD